MTETAELEEERFRQMLDRGLRLLADETAHLAEGGTLPGEVVPSSFTTPTAFRST